MKLRFYAGPWDSATAVPLRPETVSRFILPQSGPDQPGASWVDYAVHPGLPCYERDEDCKTLYTWRPSGGKRSRPRRPAPAASR